MTGNENGFGNVGEGTEKAVRELLNTLTQVFDKLYGSKVVVSAADDASSVTSTETGDKNAYKL